MFNLETLRKSGSGNAVNGAKIRKWPGVNACKSDGFEDNGVRGREFKHASICAVKVAKFSNEKTWLPTILLRWNLNDFTAASQIPP